MRFFFDRCMSITLCRMVGQLETGKHTVDHHDEDSRFTQTTPDTFWIDTVSKDAQKPVVVTGDCRILKKPDEVKALKSSGLTFFCLADQWVSLPIYDMTWKFFKIWPDISKKAKTRTPTVFRVRAGKSLKIEEYSATGKL